MNGKPILTIDKFSGFGQNGILFCEGFYPEIDNGKFSLGEGFCSVSRANTSTTGFSTMNTVYAGIQLVAADSSYYNMYLDANGTLFVNQISGSSIADGKIHQTSFVTGYLDLTEAYNGDILFSSYDYIGKGISSTVTGGSTTTLVDTTKNFVDEGIAVNDKVTNLKTGIEYTITSITTTTNANDTLNFTASGTNTNTAGDNYIAWDNNCFSISNVSEKWQPSSNDFRIQMKLYGTQIFFTNGNYIGALSADVSTVDKTYKQLPYKNQAIAIGVNNSSILVSSFFNGKGALLLWDGYSDGWNNIIELDSPVYALTNYSSGWVFVSKGSVYYTDGYQTKKIYSSNVSRKTASSFIEPKMHNGLVVYDDTLYCACINDDNNFISPGVYAIDINNPNFGFTLIRSKKLTRYNGKPYCVFVLDGGILPQEVEAAGDGFIDYISHGSASAGQYADNSAIFFINLPQQIRVTGIGLNITRYLKAFGADTVSRTRDIQVSIGDADRGIISVASSTSNTTSAITLNGETYLNNKIGDELYISDSTSPLFGERTFITDISGAGTSSEVWSVSPALSTTDTSTGIKTIRVKKLDRITLNNNGLKEEVIFINNDTGFLSNKLFIEIVVFGQASAMPININSIKIYGG